MLKKAAMFGLDARITLVIFASISFISYAIYKDNIKSNIATQYLNDMKSVIQAYKNFKNDTGYKVTEFSNPYYYNISQLVSLPIDNSKPYTKMYNGPYIEYDLTGSDSTIHNPSLNVDVSMVSVSYNNSWVSTPHPDTTKCSDTDCFKWIVFLNVPNYIAKKIDLIADGSESDDTGSIRLKANGSNYDVFMSIETE